MGGNNGAGLTLNHIFSVLIMFVPKEKVKKILLIDEINSEMII